MRRPQREEAGYSLIIAVVVVVFLTLVASRALQTVNVDVQLASNHRESESALYIAEAGIAYGLDKMRDDYSLDTANPSFDAALADTINAPLVPSSDACEEADSCKIFGWHQLTNGPQSFGGGSYWVVFNDDDDGDGQEDVDGNRRILLRSLGTNAQGARRLIEVAIGVPQS